MALLIGVALALIATVSLKAYGWGLFVALPFCLGLFSVLLYGYHLPRGYGSCILVSLLSVSLPGLALP